MNRNHNHSRGYNFRCIRNSVTGPRLARIENFHTSQLCYKYFIQINTSHDIFTFQHPENQVLTMQLAKAGNMHPSEAWKLEYAACVAAMHGETLPGSLNSAPLRASVTHGIRSHLSFASSDAVIDLCKDNAHFRRARNARLIMSNIIPEAADMAESEHQPYCIWFPDIASEDTYGKLAATCPDMRY